MNAKGGTRGERVVITDPKDISDPLSDVIASLAAQVAELREQQQESALFAAH